MYHGLSSGRLMSSGARGWRKKSLLTLRGDLLLLSESSLLLWIWGLRGARLFAEGFLGALEFCSGDGPEVPDGPDPDPDELPEDPPPVQV